MSTLHVTNGSAAGDKLQTFVDGAVVTAADVLHDGPAPGVDGDEWYDTRARYLSGYGGYSVDQVRADLAATDRTIAEAARRGDPIVLWFEHDLFDQLLLIRTLDLLNRAAGSRPNVSLICIDRFPGVERFVGLGQLEPAQLASLYPSLAPVTPEQRALATAAWAAFRSTDPRALLDIAEQASADPLSIQALPFLGDALHRFFAEFPSVENGLTHTESLALSALGEAPMSGGTLFGAAQRHEPRPFMGDLTFYRILTTLASARVPLVAIAGLPGQMDLRDHTVEILDAGRDVFARRRDRVALNGIDMWRGGVHLNGVDRSPWRWDARRKTLVS